MKKLSFINKIIYLLNSLLATGLLLSYLLPWVSPRNLSSFAILSLLVPILMLINLVFVVYWLIQLKKQFLLSALILGLGYFVTTPLYKFDEGKSSLNSDLKIMSYNVRMFNHWQWIEDDKIPEKISNFVSDKEPDILLLQEFHKTDSPKFDYPYKYIKLKNPNSTIGLAIYSNYRIINKGSLELSDTSNNIIFADVVKDKDTIRIYNLHLQSLELNTKAENFGQENSEKLLARLRAGFKKQAEQTEEFLVHEANWEGKKIVAGDFNNTAYSWVYKQIANNKKDGFIEAGDGFGKTFNYSFPLRIDFILVDENAIVNQFTSFKQKNSDHYPIQARINW